MTEKAVIIHSSAMTEWSQRQDPPLALSAIQKALKRIEEVVSTLPPEDIIFVEESPDTGYITLPQRVGNDNSAMLYGARAGYCLKIAREVLENAGIPVSIDTNGSLP